MRMPKTLEGVICAASFGTGALMFGGAWGIETLSQVVPSTGVEIAQAEACASSLPTLGSMATKSQIEATPCRSYIDGFGTYETKTVYYEPGTDSSNSTGSVKADDVRYGLPTPQKFLDQHIITAAEAKKEQRDPLKDASIYGGIATLALGSILTLGFGIPLRRAR